MLVIGTAGHIDHGKSAIVKRLTNTDPDRLPEEKARGMTIDLGFAFYKTPENETIAFIDVPGHERFVKNMVSGVGGIDLVMLVIAADDGWMPQSEEHFQIVRLLKIKNGIIVINKTDMVDQEWLELLEADIKSKVAGSFLENAPIYKVSAQTGDNFDMLQDYLNELPAKIKSQRNIGKPRLYIDRSFVRPGIGGVVTGTLKGGELSVGQTVTIFPANVEAKIRTLHSNNADVEIVQPGQRTAISFTGVDKEILTRGSVVLASQENTLVHDNKVLALSVEMLPQSAVPLEDRRRMLCIVGTTEVEGEVRLLDGKYISPGEKGIIFFKPENPLYALLGDKWIGRLPTPMITIGGGEVLDYLPYFPRKKNIESFAYLNERLNITLEKLILSELQKEFILPKEDLLPLADFSEKAINNQIKNMWQKKVIQIFEGHIYFETYFKNAITLFKKEIEQHLEENAHLNGLLFEQMEHVSIFNKNKIIIFLKYLCSTGEILKNNDKYTPTGQEMILKGAVKNTYEIILKELTENKYTPPTIQNLIHLGKQARNAIRFIIDTSQAYKCGSDLLFLTENWNDIIRFIKETITKNNELKVSDLKDKFELSRKYSIPILEETDRLKITKRNGDVRIRGENFES